MINFIYYLVDLFQNAEIPLRRLIIVNYGTVPEKHMIQFAC